MRKFSLFLLLATSAMPALAEPGDDGDRQSRRASQADRSESRPQRAERAERPQRAERSEAPQERQMQVERPVQAEGPRVERIQRHHQRVEAQQQQEQADGQPSRSERIEQFRRRQLGAGQQAGSGGLVPRERHIRTIPTTTPQVGQVGPVRTDVTSALRTNRDDRHRWTNHWRHDHRYDWRRHRDHHRSLFHIGFYFDPFGYSYRRFGLGSYLYPNYYQSNYWLSDPWQYRLPPAYGPYRWIRYHNDAVMIDTWTGEVVDVIYGFFW